MKKLLCILSLSVILLPSCIEFEKIDLSDSPTMLLVAIKENNHMQTEFEYDSLNRLIQLNSYNSDAVVYYETYSYDSIDRLIKRTFAGYIETYEYSSDGKLLTAIKYYDATQKEWKIEYEYENDMITKGNTFYNGSESGYIEFKYDSTGNTIERTEYSTLSGQEGFINTQYKLSYDDNKNPIKNIMKFPVDFIQNNNPVNYYYYDAMMSKPPDEYNSTFDYDTTGFPIKEYRDSQIFDYEYSETK